MASSTASVADATESSSDAQVDPRAPRFGQAITATVLGIGIAVQRPVFVYAIAVVLGVAVVSQWRFDAYRFLWKTVISHVVKPPESLEAAAPHRFAKLLGATFTAFASLLFVGGFPTVGYVIAAIVVILAGVAAVFDLCVGCRMYREVSYVQTLGWL